jgi:hypothetical protein
MLALDEKQQEYPDRGDDRYVAQPEVRPPRVRTSRIHRRSDWTAKAPRFQERSPIKSGERGDRDDVRTLEPTLRR